MTKKLSLLFLICILSSLNINATVYSGSWYDIKYSLDTSTGVLKITGVGEINYSNHDDHGPWYSYRGYVKIVEIADGVTRIGNWAFKDHYNLNEVIIPNSVTSIGHETFRECKKLSSITIPNSVTSIGDYAFSGCSGLTSVEIPNSVTSIDFYAFEGCSSLTSVTIPNSVTSIGNNAFEGCSGLTKVTLNSNAIASKSYSSSYTLGSIFGSQIKEYILGEDVTAIGNYAFYNCNSLTSITIPNSVTSIGYRAFEGCFGLTSVIIPNSVTSIGSSAFSGCSGITSVTIPNSVTNIGNRAFSPKPTKVIWLTNTPPSGYTNVEGEVNYVANNNYTSLSNKMVYPFLSSMFEVDGVKYVPVSPSERTCDAIDCVYGNSSTEININSTVAFKGVSMKVQNVNPYTFYEKINLQKISFSITGKIDKYVCSGCTNLQTAVFGQEVTEIEDYAFQGCSKIDKIIIPDAVNTIGQYAFSGCSSLNDVQIGQNVISIGGYAFSGCSTLPKIQIPQSVTSIANNAFQGCSGLKTMIMDNGDSDLSLSSNVSYPMFTDCPLDSVYIGRNITYNTSSSYGYSPFYRNTSLRTVVITDKETEISDNEFYGCTNLQNFKVGDGVTKFGKYAFSGCSSLKSLSFGAQLQSIGQEAFSDCNAVTTIVSKATTPPVCGSQALDDISKWECSLYVPEGNLSAYQAADQWKEFFFTAEGAEDIDPEEQDPTINKCNTPTINIVDGKIKFASETEGVEFIYRITPSTSLSGSGDEAPMLTKYTISVYAKKDGFIQSDEATKEIKIGNLDGIRGDINNDGTVSMPDAMFIVNKILNGKFPDEE